MKILCQNFSNALYHIALGWKNVFESIGCQWVWWEKGTPAFDAFDTVEPDLFIGTTYGLDTATIKCLLERQGKIHVVLKGNNSTVDLGAACEQDQYPIGIAHVGEYKMVCDDFNDHILDGGYDPVTIFNFYHKNRLKGTMDGWENCGCRILDMQPAADTFTYYPVESVRELQCDIGFVGGYWGYKGKNFNKYLLPLLYPVGKYNVKIFGNQAWPVVQYMGMANDRVCNALFSSALVCPNVSEPHANTLGFEVNERVFKLAACKAFCISDYIESLDKDVFKNGEMVLADSPEQFHDLVHNFINNPHLRDEHIDACYETVMKEHTYFDRIHNLLTHLGEEKLATQVKESKENRIGFK